MTNTHINVGGHKITTNKVGTVKDGTINTTYLDTGSWCYYIVVNGICCVSAYMIVKTTFSNVSIVTDLPESKTYMAINIPFSNTQRGLCAIGNNSGTMQGWSGGSSGNAYVSFAYPVVDDWVES